MRWFSLFVESNVFDVNVFNEIYEHVFSKTLISHNGIVVMYVYHARNNNLSHYQSRIGYL
ncbi:hypothetical protein VCRA2116O29_270035 [Vibrio crassostreae]|nr:hypothetical protein VCRA2116O29_270035 [Vibrio crassostreae]CAK2486372.1 hypothetical protein VCRA2119O48_390047 [Vibrio crassostreae]CAK2690245.1 hypothetical protein VCRA2120E331_130053 [Vibrio crassostreae]CAK3189362.1 hypothetical protein VCRA2127O345_130053 [Vibrio crassostreae]CAK3214171.1 hypothetical protein VCRA2120E330_140054 [Vibrio crassostreae]